MESNKPNLVNLVKAAILIHKVKGKDLKIINQHLLIRELQYEKETFRKHSVDLSKTIKLLENKIIKLNNKIDKLNQKYGIK